MVDACTASHRSTSHAATVTEIKITISHPPTQDSAPRSAVRLPLDIASKQIVRCRECQRSPGAFLAQVSGEPLLANRSTHAALTDVGSEPLTTNRRTHPTLLMFRRTPGTTLIDFLNLIAIADPFAPTDGYHL